MKICGKCKENKELVGFCKDKSKKDGLRSICKICDGRRSSEYSKTDKGKICHNRAQKKYVYNKTPEQKAKQALYHKEYEKTDKGKATQARFQKKYRNSLKGKEAIAKGHKKYQKTDKGKIAQKKYHASPKGKGVSVQAHRKYRQTPKGKAKHAATAAKYRAAKLQRTPKWLTPEDYKKIQIFYDEAARLTQETGTEYHVDHIIPLQGENVSGLHVPENLQVLIGPGPDGNCSKNNKYEL